jgi:hypothetical protein
VIDFGISGSYLSTRSYATRSSSFAPNSSTRDSRLNALLASRASYRYADRKIGRLQDSLAELRSLWARGGSGSVGGAAGPVRVTSSDPIDLGVESAATLSSPLAIDTVTTSYSTTSPEWDGSSTAGMTIGGTYDGSSGTQSLTLQVTRGGEIGDRNPRIAMFDEDGLMLGEVMIHKFDAPDTVYDFGNGLTITVDAGFLGQGDTATLDVAVNQTPLGSDQSFDDVAMVDRETGSALEIADGSITVNGTAVSVFADDSIASIVDRINASGAGVSAVFDAASGAILMESEATGSGAEIVLADDTSGFLAAMGLDEAVVTPGADGGLNATMSDVFAGLNAGALSINGTSVAFDPDVDSLGDLIGRINASGAGVSASLSGDRVGIQGLDPTAALVLDDGGTGVFAALSLAGGTHEPTAAGSDSRAGFSRHQSSRIARVMGEISEAMNELLAAPDDASLNSSLLGGLRSAIRERVSDAYGTDGTRFRSGIGIDFDFSGGGRKVFSFHDADRSTFAAAIRGDAGGVEEFLFGEGGGDEGLLGSLEDLLDGTMSTIDDQLGSVGRALDTRA